jgi:hypothetical protein
MFNDISVTMYSTVHVEIIPHGEWMPRWVIINLYHDFMIHAQLMRAFSIFN